MKKNEFEQTLITGMDTRVPDVWDRIAAAPAEETVPPVATKSRPFTRIIATAACAAIVLGAATAGMLWNGSRNDLGANPTIVYGQDTPVRIGEKGGIMASFAEVYTFEQAYQNAVLVADLTITEWKGELNEKGLQYITYFTATINHLYKDAENRNPQTITLVQKGNSQYTLASSPLYKNGDRLLLCLFDVTGPEYLEPYGPCYVTHSGQTSVLYIEEEQNSLYALKQNHYSNFEDIADIQTDKATAEKLAEKVMDDDPILSEAHVTFECAYPFAEIERVMNEMD